MAFAESGNARIFFDVVEPRSPWIADAETILFHHGIGIDHRMWTKWIAPLADRYRLVCMDMRGFGRSTVPPPDARWTMEELVADVLAVAQAAGAERFHFVGESMGATIGLCSYFASPRAFRTLTLSNGAHMGGPLRNLDDWRDVIAASGMKGWSEMMSEHRFYDDGLPAEERAWFTRAQEQSPGHSCVNAVAVLRGVDLSPRLSEIRVPVLLLHGDSSPFIPASLTATLHAALPDAEMHIFGHAKHGLPLSHGTQCAQTLRSFLQRRRG